MDLVSVFVTADFALDGQLIERGAWIDMSPIQAAVEARLGHVSLLHGSRPTYQTRDMVAVTVPAAAISIPQHNPVTAPKKRRRGRPRKSHA